ncbi:MAG: hypothetical protein KY442_08010 [Proteobacteria bacterium]|nr:hypothetical protein [Pseudomonadota bacterium]
MNPASQTPWPGWSSQKTLVLPLSPDRWSPPTDAVEIDGLHFAPKRELHVTLVGRRIGQALHAGLGERRVRSKAVREAFCALDWRFTRTHELHRLQKREQMGHGAGRCIGSIVELIEMPALAVFYRTIGELLGREVPVPPAHVTLYTAGRAKGVGVPDTATLRRLSQRELSTVEVATASVPAHAASGRSRSRRDLHGGADARA